MNDSVRSHENNSPSERPDKAPGESTRRDDVLDVAQTEQVERRRGRLVGVAVAEVLGLPFSPYRRHLTRGVERVAAGCGTASPTALRTPPAAGEQYVSSDRSGS